MIQDDSQIKNLSLTILVVEDEESNFQVLDILLRKRLNALVLRAKSGIEAIRLCKEHPEIILVLMDIKLPLMDGFTATREIKKFLPHLPIIALTAYGLSGDEQHAIEAGCDAYVSKPYNSHDLLKRITSLIDFK